MGSSTLEFLFEISAVGDIDVCDASAHAAFNLYVFIAGVMLLTG